MKVLLVALSCFAAIIQLACLLEKGTVEDGTEIRSQEDLVGTWHGSEHVMRQDGTSYESLRMILTFEPDGEVTVDRIPLEHELEKSKPHVSSYTFRSDGVLEIQPKGFAKKEYRVMRSVEGAIRFHSTLPDVERQVSIELLVTLTFRKNQSSN